jgi:hypothetical protein
VKPPAALLSRRVMTAGRLTYGRGYSCCQVEDIGPLVGEIPRAKVDNRTQNHRLLLTSLKLKVMERG